MNEYSSEKFIQQYEHIRKLQLLTDEELTALKKRRAQFEVSIKSSGDVKSYIEYIKYERVLMKKLNRMDYENENDGKAIDRALASHIKDIFKQALRRFQNDRQLWMLYLEFAKLKFPNIVTSIYQEMLGFHHTKDDYIEAVRHEMDKKNYYVAINFLIQGMSKEKDSMELVSLHIYCYLQHAEAAGDEKFKEQTLLQVNKFYDKFIKGTKDVSVYIDLLQKIQNIKCSITFQNEVLGYILKAFTSRPEVWNIFANRHLDGLFFEDSDSKNADDIPFETRLKYALCIYDKSLEIVDDGHKKEMYEIYLTKLTELDSLTNINENCIKHIKAAFGKTLISGFTEDLLSEKYFVDYLMMRVLHKDKYAAEIEEIITKGIHLFPNSMDFYEVAIKYYFSIHNYDKISGLFNQAIKCNEKNAVVLYKFLCEMYLTNPDDKDRARRAMMEAIESNNKKLSASFQPYVLDYYASVYGVVKAREMYKQILSSKNVASLSIDFFTTMIMIEKSQLAPNHKIIQNCFERAVMLFGRNNPEIWLDFIQYNWEKKKFSEATSLRNRAIESMKGDLKNIEQFELKYTLLMGKNEKETN